MPTTVVIRPPPFRPKPTLPTLSRSLSLFPLSLAPLVGCSLCPLLDRLVGYRSVACLLPPSVNWSGCWLIALLLAPSLACSVDWSLPRPLARSIGWLAGGPVDWSVCSFRRSTPCWWNAYWERCPERCAWCTSRGRKGAIFVCVYIYTYANPDVSFKPYTYPPSPTCTAAVQKSLGYQGVAAYDKSILSTPTRMCFLNHVHTHLPLHTLQLFIRVLDTQVLRLTI